MSFVYTNPSLCSVIKEDAIAINSNMNQVRGRSSMTVLTLDVN